jgi:hypothetical protein
MKRTLLIFLLVFILMQFIQTEQINIKAEKNLEIKAPEYVMKVFKTSCYDCHSNEVKWPWYSDIAPFSWIISSHVNVGRQWINFSLWETYSEKDKKKKLKEIFRTVYASMPLPSYTAFHEGTDLSREQRSMIRDWTGVKK